jgi:hypothetical protein
VRGRGQVEGVLRLAHGAPGVETAAHRGAGLAQGALEARLRQEDRQEVHQATEQRKREQQNQPIQLAPGAHHVHGEKQGYQEVNTQTEYRHVCSSGG